MAAWKRFFYNRFGMSLYGPWETQYLEGRRNLDFIYGRNEARELLRRDMNNLSDIKLNTAVVGNSGTGKSSFINSLRGMTAEDKGAAKVGVMETTVECKPYTHPENKNFIVWDLPGVGTTDFPKASYLDRVRYDKYDFFIIMGSSRFTENDLWLAREIQKRNKKFFFVRSKIDIDVENDKYDYPSTHNEKIVIQTIRKKTEDQLERSGVRSKVFLISNHRRDKYDFKKLNRELLSLCDGYWRNEVKELLRRDMNNLSNIKLNTAVVGNSGTGKSSFINAIRGLTAKDNGAAEVGVMETTVECKPYTHPENKSFIVWDLPGVGTPNFPKASYLDRVRYDKYDFFIIMSSSRFTENDLWLAREIQKRNKKFFFVRSKIDIDVENDKYDYLSTHNEKIVIQTIRMKTEDQLERSGVRSKVFLISNHRRDKYDFKKLNRELLSLCDGYGRNEVKELLRRDMNNLSDIKLNTAVVGISGTGKSSFINAIRGLTAKDKGAAEVGVTETTVECKPYTHPENKSFIVWDLPGVGTPNFPKASYLDRVRYDKYDFFIIMSSGRFTENDLWLAREIQKRNKKFFFVRSKIDIDVENDKYDYPSTHNEKIVIQTIRKKTEDELGSHGVRSKVFLINNYRRDKYDFRKLSRELLSLFDG